MYRFVITVLPLVPIIILITQNALNVDDLLDTQSIILDTEAKVSGATNLALFVSRIQDERFESIFAMASRMMTQNASYT